MHVSDLPQNLLDFVYGYLDQRDLTNFSQTCSNFRTSINNCPGRIFANQVFMNPDMLNFSCNIPIVKNTFIEFANKDDRRWFAFFYSCVKKHRPDFLKAYCPIVKAYNVEQDQTGKLRETAFDMNILLNNIICFLTGDRTVIEELIKVYGYQVNYFIYVMNRTKHFSSLCTKQVDTLITAIKNNVPADNVINELLSYFLQNSSLNNPCMLPIQNLQIASNTALTKSFSDYKGMIYSHLTSNNISINLLDKYLNAFIKSCSFSLIPDHCYSEVECYNKYNAKPWFINNENFLFYSLVCYPHIIFDDIIDDNDVERGCVFLA
jgi:hypothetical protein